MHLGMRYLTRLFKLPWLGWYICSELCFIKFRLVITINAAGGIKSARIALCN